MPATTSDSSVSFVLGDDTSLPSLFPYVPSAATLADCIQHTINETLSRDLQYGAWAHVAAKPDAVTKLHSYHVTITSPDPKADVRPYQTLLQGFVAAAGRALALYYQGMGRPVPTPMNVSFLPPFGLAMLNTASIQLLHYPPSETKNYADYLYSPTNRRWESLLGYNGHPGAQYTLLETIVDLLPIAADGGASGAAALKCFDPQKGAKSPPVFQPYVEEMLRLILRPTSSATATQPVVAYGGPVMNFLAAAYPESRDQATEVTGNRGPELWPLSLIQVPFVKGGPPTWILCANHPAQFMYYSPSTAAPGDAASDTAPSVASKIPFAPKAKLVASANPKLLPEGAAPASNNDRAHFMKVLQQDLVAAGWQSQMSRTPDADAVATLKAQYDKWFTHADRDLLNSIFDQQVQQFV
jgi:hypothetical protein